MQRKIALFVLLTAIYFALGLFAGISPPLAADTNDESLIVIADEVFTALEQNSEVLVAIALHLPDVLQRTLTDYNHGITAMQQDVLQGLDPDAYTLIHRFRSVPGLAMWIKSQKILHELASNPSVLKVDLDVGGQGSLNQSRPWVNADQAQSAGMTGAGRIVAVLDSGFDSDHPDLSDALVDEHCNCYNPSVHCCPLGDSVQNGPGSAEDDNGHGSHVSGIITGNGNNAPLGIAPGANIVAVKVLDSNGSFYSSSDIVAALDWILNHRPEVDAVNMSLGTNMEFSGDCDNSFAWTMNLANAVNALRFEGILCVASSMNSGNSAGMAAPACISNVIAVGATFDNQDLITSYSNSSPSLDVLAPGNLITATAMGGGSITMSGTSMAASHVTATAALLRQKNPTVQASQMEAALETSPVLISDSRNGISRPRLDVKAALDVITVLPGTPWIPLLLLDD